MEASGQVGGVEVDDATDHVECARGDDERDGPAEDGEEDAARLVVGTDEERLVPEPESAHGRSHDDQDRESLEEFQGYTRRLW